MFEIFLFFSLSLLKLNIHLHRFAPRALLGIKIEILGNARERKTRWWLDDMVLGSGWSLAQQKHPISFLKKKQKQKIFFFFSWIVINQKLGVTKKKEKRKALG